MSPSVWPVTLSVACYPQCVLSPSVCPVTLSVSCHPQCPVTFSVSCHPRCVLPLSVCPVTLGVPCHPQCVLSPSVCHAAIHCFQRCCRRAHCCATVRPCACRSWATTSRATPVPSLPCRQPPAVSPSWRVSLCTPCLPLPFLTENSLHFSPETLLLT